MTYVFYFIFYFLFFFDVTRDIFWHYSSANLLFFLASTVKCGPIYMQSEKWLYGLKLPFKVMRSQNASEKAASTISIRALIYKQASQESKLTITEPKSRCSFKSNKMTSRMTTWTYIVLVVWLNSHSLAFDASISFLWMCITILIVQYDCIKAIWRQLLTGVIPATGRSSRRFFFSSPRLIVRHCSFEGLNALKRLSDSSHCMHRRNPIKPLSSMVSLLLSLFWTRD